MTSQIDFSDLYVEVIDDCGMAVEIDFSGLYVELVEDSGVIVGPRGVQGIQGEQGTQGPQGEAGRDGTGAVLKSYDFDPVNTEPVIFYGDQASSVATDSQLGSTNDGTSPHYMLNFESMSTPTLITGGTFGLSIAGDYAYQFFVLHDGTVTPAAFLSMLGGAVVSGVGAICGVINYPGATNPIYLQSGSNAIQPTTNDFAHAVFEITEGQISVAGESLDFDIAAYPHCFLLVTESFQPDTQPIETYNYVNNLVHHTIKPIPVEYPDGIMLTIINNDGYVLGKRVFVKDRVFITEGKTKAAVFVDVDTATEVVLAQAEAFAEAQIAPVRTLAQANQYKITQCVLMIDFVPLQLTVQDHSIVLGSKANQSSLDVVQALAETNQYNISQCALESDLDALGTLVTNQGIELGNKANQSALDILQAFVDSLPSHADITAVIDALVGTAPATLDTIYELASALTGEQAIVDTLTSAIGNRLRVDAPQGLNGTQQAQGRANINAEAVGVAASLIAAITPGSIGAATAADGVKARSALQSADVAPVALSGFFPDLIGKSNLFNLVYSAFTLGSNAAIAVTDTLGQMLGKLQAQVSAKLDAGATAVSATKLATARLINGQSFDGTGDITVTDSSKEPSIAAGTAGKYWSWDKTWRVPVYSDLSGLPTLLAVGSATPLAPATTGTAGTSIAASRQDHVHPLPTLAALGAATAAQGGLADSALQTSSIADIRNLTFGYSNTGVNTATTIVSVTPNNTDTNSALVLQPKGTGGIYAQIPDGTITGGNSRGVSAIDFQNVRSSAAQVASGGYAVICGGRNNTAGATGAAVLGGNGNAATGTNSVVLGGNINSATANASIAMGSGAKASQTGQFAHSALQFASQGDNQKSDYALSVAATAASTPYALTADHGAAANFNQIIVPASSLVSFEGTVTAHRRTADGVGNAGWVIKGYAARGATGNCSIVGTPTITADGGLTPPAGWAVTVAADTVNNCVQIIFNMGATPMNVNVMAVIRSNNLTN